MHVIFACLAAFAFFAVLYFFRDIDDNSLVSWRHVFMPLGGGMIFLYMLAGAGVSFFLSERKLPGPAMLSFITFVASSAFWGVPEVVIDSSRYFTQAKHLGQYGLGYFLGNWGSGIAPWTDMPLVPFIYGVVFRYLGESRLLVQVLVSVMFSLTVFFTVKLGNDLFGGGGEEGTGAIAGIFLLAVPYLYIQVPLMLVDVPCMFFLVLSVFLFQRAMKHGRPLDMAASAIAITMTLMAKYSMWMMGSVFFFMLAANIRERRAMTRGAVVLFASGILFGIFLLVYWQVMGQQLALLMNYQRPGLRWWGESFVSSFLFQTHPFVTLAAMYSVYLAIRRRDIRFIVISWLVILVFVLRVQRLRYLLPVLPMLALMASYGISDISSARLRRAIALCAAIMSFLLAVTAYRPYLGQGSLANLKMAGEYLDTLDGNDVRVLVVPQDSQVNPAVAVPLLDYYTDKDIVYCFDLKPRIRDDDIEMSSFRFTWTYANLAYYRRGGVPETAGQSSPDCRLKEGGEGLKAVVYADSEDVINEMMGKDRLLARFGRDTEDFNFRTFVNVYR